ncbi:MAG: NAD-dependent deacylase [Aquificaceae bacterium]
MRKIAVLTGAGISQESGIPTFRGNDGLWEKYDLYDLATPEGFSKNPRLVWEWYIHRRNLIKSAKPNEAHKTLVKLENKLGDGFILITQNVDNLHRIAGSKNLIELHGNIFKVKCTNCKAEYFEFGDLKPMPECKECGGLLRPGVVWFGESLPIDALNRAISYSESCDIFVCIGTSAVVYPAAELPVLAKQRGATVIEINPERTPVSDIADIKIQDKASSGVKKLLEILGI